MEGGKELRDYVVRHVIPERYLHLVEIVVEMFGDGGDVTAERITRRARTDPFFFWRLYADEKGSLRSDELGEDLQQLHVGGYLIMDIDGKVVPTYTSKRLFEQVYGEGTFRFPPESK